MPHVPLLQVRDISPLSGCFQLRHLELSECEQLQDLSAIPACTRLAHQRFLTFCQVRLCVDSATAGLGRVGLASAKGGQPWE